jgi:hypothetical protein
MTATAFALAMLLAVTPGAGATPAADPPRADLWLVLPGVLLGGSSKGSFDAAAEVSALTDTSSETTLVGAALGSSIHIHSLELEAAHVFGGGNNGVSVGLNPGVVWDREADRAGFQGTCWFVPLITCGHGCVLPLPIPFFRVRLFGGGESTWIAGLAVKVPIPFERARK